MRDEQREGDPLPRRRPGARGRSVYRVCGWQTRSTSVTDMALGRLSWRRETTQFARHTRETGAPDARAATTQHTGGDVGLGPSGARAPRILYGGRFNMLPSLASARPAPLLCLQYAFVTVALSQQRPGEHLRAAHRRADSPVHPPRERDPPGDGLSSDVSQRRQVCDAGARAWQLRPTAQAVGYAVGSWQVAVGDGAVLQQDFALEPRGGTGRSRRR